MLASLSKVQLLFLFLQILFFPLNSVKDKFDTSVILAFILCFTTIVFQIKVFSNLEEKVIIYEPQKYIYLLSLLGAGLWLFTIIGLNTIEKPMPLNALQDINNLGLLSKLGSVIIPAIAFSLFFSKLNKKIKILILILALVCSGYVAIMTLSKMSIIPYIIFSFFLVRLKIIPIYYITVLFILMIPLFYNIYYLRGSIENINEIPRMLVFRMTMLPEASYIVEWISKDNLLGFHQIKEYPRLITEVFERDPRLIGIAPSFTGFFLIIFNYFGIIVALLFIYLVSFFIARIKSRSIVSHLLYFLYSLELLSFFIDGIPHFYLSTTGGRFFWALLLLGLFFIVVENKRRGDKYAL